MKFRLSLLLAALLLLITPFSRAENCTATIVDQAGVVHNPQIIGNAAKTLINQGADVHVVIVDSVQRYGSTLADVERSFEQSCPNWVNPQTGQRKANLFVVMVAPNDRAKNIFLGSYYNGAFDVTSTYSQLSNSYFKNRQWELGLASVLQGTTSQALSFRQRTFTAQQQQRTQPPQRTYTAPTYTQVPQQVQSANTGMSGFVIFLIVMLLLVAIAAALYYIVRASNSSSSTTTYDSGAYSTPTSPSRSTRSYAAAAPSHTTVINNTGGSGVGSDGFVTGMLLGEALSRPSTVYVERSTPSYVAPTYVEPTQPTYTEPTVTEDAPDSTWEDNSQQQADTSFSDPSPSYDPPSSGSDDSGF